MYKKLRWVLLGFSCLLGACMFDAIYGTLDDQLRQAIGNTSRYILPESEDFARIPQSPVNPITAEKVALGKLLFFEPAFGVEPTHAVSLQTFSCGSCHIPAAGFRPGRHQGIADGGHGFGVKGEGRLKYVNYEDGEVDAQGARPLSVLNVAFVSSSMWNGSFGSDGVNKGTEHLWGLYDPGTAINADRLGNLEGQNIEGLKTHRMLFTKELVEANGYKELFDAAFPGVPEHERYTRTTASFALSAYIRTLLCTEAPFQRWLKGEPEAMSDQEKRGALLFFGKAGCQRCHSEPNLGSISFHALGVEDLFENGGIKTGPDDRRNLGRGGFTGRSEDMFKFRVPQLYNLGDGGPFFHGASKKTLKDVVKYFNAAHPENLRVPKSQISPFFTPLGLSDQEVDDLTAFLEHSLRDPDLQRYAPKSVLSGMCFPNNDPASAEDIGCK